MNIGESGPLPYQDPSDSAAVERSTDKESSVAQWASTVRESFGKDRKGYNFAVCDALAARGAPPTGYSVLRVGRWGTSSSVANDVSAWYSALSARLTSLEAKIPLPARRTANQLIEQLFGVAEEAASETVKSLLAPLHEEAARLTEELARAQATSAERLSLLGDEIVKTGDLTARLDVAEQRLSQVDSELGELHHAFDQQTILSAAERERAAEELTRIERRLTQADLDKSNVALEHTQALLASGQRAEDERRRLMLAADAERQEHGRLLKALDGDISTLRSKNETLRQEAGTLALEAAKYQAAAESAQELLIMEQRRTAELGKQLQSDETRFRSLVDFAGTGRVGGFTIYRVAAPNEAREWLINSLGMTAISAQHVVANSVASPPTIKNEERKSN